MSESLYKDMSYNSTTNTPLNYYSSKPLTSKSPGYTSRLFNRDAITVRFRKYKLCIGGI